MTVDPTVLRWLLSSDPALRWQVQRDLVGAPPDVWGATKNFVPTEGFGAHLLTLQDDDGQWAGGAFFPTRYGDVGPDADVLAGTAELLAAASRWEWNNLPYWGGEVDCCVNAYTLANGVWLGVDVSGLARRFMEHQMADGGWNCDWIDGSTRSSFHSTLTSLRGLLSFESTDTAGQPESLDAVRAARHRGEEYLLQRQLMHSLSTGEVVGSWVTQFAYPYRWIYSVLRAADYFRDASLVDGRAPDPRLADAVGAIRAARMSDGTWIEEHRHPGAAWFEVDVAPGEASPWLTFYATRMLEWWDSGPRVTP
jgi:hypothetical protein